MRYFMSQMNDDGILKDFEEMDEAEVPVSIVEMFQQSSYMIFSIRLALIGADGWNTYWCSHPEGEADHSRCHR